MVIVAWLKTNGFQALEALSIISSILFTAHTVRADGRARKVENLLSITASHREIWSELYNRPGLERILLRSVNLSSNPLTPKEEMFVHLVFLHTSASYQAIKEKLFEKPHSLEADIGMFLSLPIPAAVWNQLRNFYQPDFVKYAEACVAPDNKTEIHVFQLDNTI